MGPWLDTTIDGLLIDAWQEREADDMKFSFWVLRGWQWLLFVAVRVNVQCMKKRGIWKTRLVWSRVCWFYVDLRSAEYRSLLRCKTRCLWSLGASLLLGLIPDLSRCVGRAAC
jgi:hypothetical protein